MSILFSRLLADAITAKLTALLPAIPPVATLQRMAGEYIASRKKAEPKIRLSWSYVVDRRDETPTVGWCARAATFQDGELRVALGLYLSPGGCGSAIVGDAVDQQVLGVTKETEIRIAARKVVYPGIRLQWPLDEERTIRCLGGTVWVTPEEYGQVMEDLAWQPSAKDGRLERTFESALGCLLPEVGEAMNGGRVTAVCADPNSGVGYYTVVKD